MKRERMRLVDRRKYFEKLRRTTRELECLLLESRHHMATWLRDEDPEAPRTIADLFADVRGLVRTAQMVFEVIGKEEELRRLESRTVDEGGGQ